MARPTKKKKTGAKAKAPTRKKPAAKKAAGPKRAGKGQQTDVERRWRQYWQHRTDLETAVAEVSRCEASLTAARQLERARRDAFNQAKGHLQELLEVEAPSTASRKLIDFRGEPKPARPERPERPEIKDKPAPS